ncbi:DegT/DnrJ/EryC1/StrS family aminotransferase [Patescibacteria group bacterium]|nr:DegT/DnrJ/EryC1/StrS family aminotransferase [Patescibacteria group bacterium]
MTSKKAIADHINLNIVEDDDIERVVKVLKSGFLSKPEGGPLVEEFQNMIAEAHGQKRAFAVTSGTTALHCATTALGLSPGDEVLVPALANIADASTVIQEGGVPVYVDIDPYDFNIDPSKAEEKITYKTKAIIVVHMYGQPAKMDELMAIASRHNLVLIEDCAQSAGARYKDKYVGSFGDISCFSLYQTKHIICGEGGVVMTSNEEYAKIISSIANNGIIQERLDDYDYGRIGYNYQLSDIQAALAIGQFQKLDGRNITRRKNVEEYKRLLKDTGFTFQEVNPDTENSYFYLTALIPEEYAGRRDEFLSIAAEMGAPLKKLYPLSIPEFTLFKGTAPQDCTIANHITKRMFNFYVNPGLEQEDIEFMAGIAKKALEKLSN